MKVVYKSLAETLSDIITAAEELQRPVAAFYLTDSELRELSDEVWGKWGERIDRGESMEVIRFKGIEIRREDD